MDKDPAQIAAGLSEAQKRALLLMRGLGASTYADPPAKRVLTRMPAGLVERRDGNGRYRMFHVLLPLGAQVRAALLAMQEASE